MRRAHSITCRSTVRRGQTTQCTAAKKGACRRTRSAEPRDTRSKPTHHDSHVRKLTNTWNSALENLIVAQLVKKFLAIYGTWTSITAFTTVRTRQSKLPKTHINGIFSVYAYLLQYLSSLKINRIGQAFSVSPFNLRSTSTLSSLIW
jgi:hypothetical protein